VQGCSSKAASNGFSLCRQAKEKSASAETADRLVSYAALEGRGFSSFVPVQQQWQLNMRMPAIKHLLPALLNAIVLCTSHAAQLARALGLGEAVGGAKTRFYRAAAAAAIMSSAAQTTLTPCPGGPAGSHLPLLGQGQHAGV
jgi:hypothetical protein